MKTKREKQRKEEKKEEREKEWIKARLQQANTLPEV
jgi:hypothetical protein